MPFTLSAAQTIDGVATSYEVTGSGNLDDLATACSGIGMSRKDNTITFNPGTTRILAVSGTLTEQRDGVYNVRVMGSGHICWAYASGSAVVLGKAPEAGGYSKSVVNISYDNDARAWGDVFSTARGKCVIGLGAFTHNSGSFDMRGNNNNTVLVFDIWKNESGGAVLFDDVAIYAQHNHFFARSNVRTTPRTWFITGTGQIEASEVITNISSVNTPVGVLWLGSEFPGTRSCKVQGGNYQTLVNFGQNSTTADLTVVDHGYLYPYPDARQFNNDLSAYNNKITVNRSIRVTFRDSLGADITSAKLVLNPPLGGSPALTTQAFSGSSSIEVLQADKPRATKYYSDGTGYTKVTNPYTVHLVAFGYADQKTFAVNNATENPASVDGIRWNSVQTKSALVTTPYASVVTAPFSMSTSGNGTITVSAASTSKQIAEYLFKLAYDSADSAYWRGLGHVPATGTSEAISIGAINLTLAGVLSGAAISTSGNVTIGATSMPTTAVTATIITTAGINTARLTATTRIDGLPTTGTISTGGKLGFGAGSTINATGDLTISGTELAGSLTINTSAARKLTLTNCTGRLTAINVTGGGTLEIRLVGTTTDSVLPAPMGAGVTAGVVVSITKLGGGNFNIYARRGTPGSYTDIGYQSGVSSVTYVVPIGTPVEVVAWSLGCVTYSRTIDTSAGGVALAMEMTVNPSIDTALDVSPYLPNIALSLDTSGPSPVFLITFNASMTIIGIEAGKAVVHRLVGSEVALRSGFPPGSVSSIAINKDEITNQLPNIRLAVGASLSVLDRVYLDFFINTTPAMVIDPSYVINPIRADGNQVIILRQKPALDSSMMALAVRQEMERTGGMLDGKASQSSVTTLGTPLQAANYVAPANADISAIKAKTDTLVNGPTLAQIEASGVLAKEATLAQKLNTADYVAPDNTRIAQIKTKVDTLENTDLTGIARTTDITSLNDVSAQEVVTAMQAVANDFKADVSGLATQTSLNAVNTKVDAIKAKTDVLVNTDLSGVATAAQVTALGSPLQADDYVAPDNATITTINTKVQSLQNTDVSELPTLAEIESSTVLAKASAVSDVNTKVTAIKAKTDTLVNAPTVADIEASTVLAKESTVASKASQASVNALGTPLQASAYVAPDNAKIAEIKTKVDTLQNTDLTTVNSGIADIKGTGFDAAKHNLVKIKQQASLAAALSA